VCVCVCRLLRVAHLDPDPEVEREGKQLLPEARFAFICMQLMLHLMISFVQPIGQMSSEVHSLS